MKFDPSSLSAEARQTMQEQNLEAGAQATEQQSKDLGVKTKRPPTGTKDPRSPRREQGPELLGERAQRRTGEKVEKRVPKSSEGLEKQTTGRERTRDVFQRDPSPADPSRQATKIERDVMPEPPPRDNAEPTYTKEEHLANETNNATIDQQMLDYKKAYSDKHGSSSGGTDDEWNAYQQGLDDLKSQYTNR